MYVMEHKVHLSDTDTTGQVYYARPLEWMEWCRVNWFENKYGNFMKYVENTNITFFPAKVNIEYKKPIFFGDDLVVEMTAKDIKKVSFTLDYLVKRSGDLVINAEIQIVCFDVKSKRFGRLSEDLMAYIEEIKISEKEEISL